MQDMKLRMCAAVLLLLVSGVARAADEAGRTVVLDRSGFWRVSYTLKTPILLRDGTVVKVANPCDTPYPPADWTKVDFEDSGWLRRPGSPLPAVSSGWHLVSQIDAGAIAFNATSPCIALIALRGKFTAADPAKVRGLRLSADFRGGFVAYLNGSEFARSHLPAGPVTMETPAEPYPDEAYLYPNGQFLDNDHTKAEKNLERYKMRTRHVEAVEIPASLLRKGVNVLSVELHRAPYPAFVEEKLESGKGRDLSVYKCLWDTCGVVNLRLDADGADGLAPNVVRPKGVQVWNSPALTSDFDLDFGDPNEPLGPVRIVGTRGGAFNGKCVVGSDGPLKDLRAEVSALIGPGGARIAASAVQVRYALSDRGESGANGHYPAAASCFDGLSETPPREVPVRQKERTRESWIRPGQPACVFGAVQPVWLTVHVPPDAAAGEYAGTLTLTASGLAATQVPIRLKVDAFRLPPPREFRTFVEVIQSPDSLALHYGVKPWSDEHFALIEQSLGHLATVGNRTVYLPLICNTNLGNEESMVRWVRKGGGGYTYDFSIVDRYLDLCEKQMGKPEAVCIGVWETFLEGGFLRYAREGEYAANEIWETFDKVKGLGPRVTLYDPAAGTAQNLQLPLYTDEEKSKPLWRPLFVALRECLEKRGLLKAARLGYPNDAEPAKVVADFFKDIAPGMPWLKQSHSSAKDVHGVPYALQMIVWHLRFLVYPEWESQHGWRNPIVQFARNYRDDYPITHWRLIGEMNIFSGQRGFGRFGAEFWPVLKDPRGRAVGTVATRYPETRWRNLSIATSLLRPGEKGPLSTARLEMIREGVQECEARIVIEESLLDEARRQRLPGDLAARCEAALKARTLAILQGLDSHRSCGFSARNVHSWWNDPGQVGGLWYLGSGWQPRSDELYSLAAEVQAATR